MLLDSRLIVDGVQVQILIIGHDYDEIWSFCSILREFLRLVQNLACLCGGSLRDDDAADSTSESGLEQHLRRNQIFSCDGLDGMRTIRYTQKGLYKPTVLAQCMMYFK